ncbi:uncharacterized protein LOC688924 isoform X2 [Rattus norvegicus]|uniref:uncharacterized protein LOC688924 isoform X2 n=1 Tax=Rattus norvegicus TaxID=10116 RepID=UPI002FD7B985
MAPIYDVRSATLRCHRLPSRLPVPVAGFLNQAATLKGSWRSSVRSLVNEKEKDEGLLTKLLRLPFNTFGSPAKDYLCLSVTSFCFCILLAIPALLFSLKTREANSVGDWRRAQRNSRLALGFSISSIIVGCLLMASSISLVFETEDMTSS